MLRYAADAPSAADWLEAWATLAGALLSAAAVLVAVLVLRRELNNRREDKDDIDAAQARLVIARITRAETDIEGNAAVAVEVANNSLTSIFELNVAIDMSPVGGGWFRMPAGDLGTSETYNQVLNFERQLDPMQPLMSFETLTGRRIFAVKVSIQFVDCAGLRWERVEQMQPIRVRDDVQQRALTSLVADYLYLTYLPRQIGRACRRGRQTVISGLSRRLIARRAKALTKRRRTAGLARGRSELNPRPSADSSEQGAAASE